METIGFLTINLFLITIFILGPLPHANASGISIDLNLDNFDDPQTQMEREQVAISVITTRSLDTPYIVQAHAFGQNLNLTLARPRQSIFSPSFKFEPGQNMTRADLDKIEENIFVDQDSHAVLQVTPNGDGGHDLVGYVNGISLNNKQGLHYASRPVAQQSFLSCGSKSNPQPHHAHESSGAHPHSRRPKRTKRKPGRTTREQNQAVAEVFVLYDQTLFSLIFQQDYQRMAFHATVMMNAVNTIWADLKEYPIRVSVIGVRALNVSEEYSVIHNSNGCISYMLKSIEEWTSADPPTHGVEPCDLLALITGVITISDGGATTTTGLATTPGACGKQKGSVSRDFGGEWTGVITVAHELGHNLGADHDFAPQFANRADCVPGQYDDASFIMGYGQKTANKCHFSPCSHESISTFFSTTDKTTGQKGGACFYKNSYNGPLYNTNAQPGESASLNDQCSAFIREQLTLKPEGGKIQQVNDAQTRNCNKFPCPYFDLSGNGYTIDLRPNEGTPCLTTIYSCNCNSNICTNYDVLGTCKIGFCVPNPVTSNPGQTSE